MPQPDSGDNCCDCPSRASPCDDCGTTGACCFSTGPCEQLTEAECIASVSGFFQGVGTDCDDAGTCLMACCHRDGICTDIKWQACSDLDGQPRGYGSICEYGQCGQCCLVGECDPLLSLCGVAGESVSGCGGTLAECTTAGGNYYDGFCESCGGAPEPNFVCCNPITQCCIDFGGGDFECGTIGIDC